MDVLLNMMDFIPKMMDFIPGNCNICTENDGFNTEWRVLVVLTCSEIIEQNRNDAFFKLGESIASATYY